MTDTPTPAPSATDPAPSTDAPRPKVPLAGRWDWRPKARWFAAEIVVVVAGILIALALNAWWGDRQSAAQERVYLGQLAADLHANERRLEGSIAGMQRSMSMSAKLLAAYTEPDRADPDSVALWVSQVTRASRPSVALSVARALATTDLDVVRDDSVRTAIFDLLTTADSYATADREFFAAFVDYSHQFRPFNPMSARLAARKRTGTGLGDSTFLARFYPVLPFEADGRVAYPVDVEALLRSREAYMILDGLYEAASDLRTIQMILLRALHDVEDLLARRGIVYQSEDDR